MQIRKFPESRIPKSSRQKLTAIGAVCPSETASMQFGMLAKPLIHSQPLSREISRMMPKDLKELLGVFNRHGVKYLVVGGYAHGVHAEPRATRDLEIFIGSDEATSKA